MHRAENQQKEFKKKSRKKMKTYNSYVKPKFLTKERLKTSLPRAKKMLQNKTKFSLLNSKYNITVPTTATGLIKLQKSHYNNSIMARAKHDKDRNTQFTISLPNQNESTFTGKAKVASDNSIVYANYQENTDVVVQAFKDSIRVLTVLNDADAPTEYRYKINIPADGKVKKTKNGGILIFDKNNKLFGGFAPPWAVDKNGEKIPTHYEIEDNELIQIVNHLNVNATYPIVADPYGGYNLIWGGSWRWEKKDNVWGWVLYAFPTNWARRFGGNYWVGVYGFNELYNKGWIDLNYAGMRDQFICHHQYAYWRKGAYHLEEWRPNVGYWHTVAALCNPK